jgi:hypothetical protein
MHESVSVNNKCNDQAISDGGLFLKAEE